MTISVIDLSRSIRLIISAVNKTTSFQAVPLTKFPLVQDCRAGGGQQDEPQQLGYCVWALPDASPSHRGHDIPVLSGGLPSPGPHCGGPHRLLLFNIPVENLPDQQKRALHLYIHAAGWCWEIFQPIHKYS